MSHATLVAAPTVVFKRDGREEPFDLGRIERAIALCYADIQKVPPVHPRILATRAVEKLHDQSAVMVEGVQDAVVKVLTEIGDTKAKNHYVEYRAERERERNDRPIPAEVKAAFDLSAQYFPTPIQQFQFFDKYSRFDHELGRRETWEETVNRAVSFLHELTLPHGNPIDGETWERVRRGILNMEIMPSMRLLAMAGPAARRNHISIFNCSFQGVDSLDSFVEALLISMSGCGVGYSVEQQYVEKLPRVKRQKKSTKVQYHIDDTTEGWCDALRTGLTLWFEGHDVEFDYSAIRPAGAILRTKGGRASGPDPLRVMMDRIRATILSRQGNVLRPIDAHDIMCHVGSAAVQGGVRRTAMISLFDWDDNLMLHAKDGDLIASGNTQRWNANNSIVWPEQGITQNDLLRQMLAMDTSQNGEPGIFNRAGAWANLPERRKALGYKQLGTNPCGEILLRSQEFCNLSIAVARPWDTPETLEEKVELAAVIGTIQSLATNFHGLRPEWKQNCDEERLLGVDITGQADSPITRYRSVLDELQEVAISTNKQYASLLGINQSAAVTCVKPSGNSSQLLNTSSGLHPRHAQYYRRNIRVGTDSPMHKVLRNAGVPMSPENGQSFDSATTWVIHFPVKAPSGAITRDQVSAIQQCEVWLRNKIHWTEHNPSVTISYGPDELIPLVQWVWEHREVVGGMSFLPRFDARYDNMPYETITADEYERLAAEFPEIDYSKLFRYDGDTDNTTASGELACFAGNCEVEVVPTGEGK